MLAMFLRVIGGSQWSQKLLLPWLFYYTLCCPWAHEHWQPQAQSHREWDPYRKPRDVKMTLRPAVRGQAPRTVPSFLYTHLRVPAVVIALSQQCRKRVSFHLEAGSFVPLVVLSFALYVVSVFYRSSTANRCCSTLARATRRSCSWHRGKVWSHGWSSALPFWSWGPSCRSHQGMRLRWLWGTPATSPLSFTP